MCIGENKFYHYTPIICDNPSMFLTYIITIIIIKKTLCATKHVFQINIIMEKLQFIVNKLSMLPKTIFFLIFLKNLAGVVLNNTCAGPAQACLG